MLSQDDVSYYHYMDGDGFAQKLIVDENGDVKNTYIEDDGSVSVGDYDMVPLIDTFVKEHPDFSYHGHKGIIALTGYEGVLGYRTDEVYRTREASRVTEYQQKFFDENPDFDWDSEVAQAKEVAQAMKDSGWEFASHTWGHINPLAYGYDATVQDTERWLNNVATVVGDTDVLIFAFGADIGDWQPYTSDNQYFTYLKSQGFNIFCNVDSSQYWVQFGDNYMRQGRRNLDGYRMYYNPDMLTDLFDVSLAWDDSRPTRFRRCRTGKIKAGFLKEYDRRQNDGRNRMDPGSLCGERGGRRPDGTAAEGKRHTGETAGRNQRYLHHKIRIRGGDSGAGEGSGTGPGDTEKISCAGSGSGKKTSGRRWEKRT